MNYSLEELASMLQCTTTHIVKPEQISAVLFDSRRTPPLGGSLFFALKGTHNDGHLYINEMVDKGVNSFVVDRGFSPKGELLAEVNFFFVDDTLLALQRFGKAHRIKYINPLIAITGSNGKTIVKEWISQLCEDDFVLVRSPRSYNSQIGVPLSLSLINYDTELAVIEAGISSVGEMEKLESIIKPTIGVLTNIGTAHQENFSSIEEKLLQKLILFKSAHTVVFCADHPLVKEAVHSQLSGVSLFSWGRSAEANLHILSEAEMGQGKLVYFVYEGISYKLELPYTDYSSFENFFHAFAALLVVGLPIDRLIGRVKNLQPVAMRLEQKEGLNGCLVVNDSYNADINGLEVALDYLASMGKKSGLTQTLILSDIEQSGVDQAVLCSKVAQMVERYKVTRFVGIGPALLSNRNLFTIKSDFYSSTREFLASGDRLLFRNEAILIKGSRSFAFERISEFLESKRHRTTLEINLNGIVSNLNYYRSHLASGTKVLAMVKAFSYGSGSFEIANLLANHKVDYLGVAFADEGVELREAGINLPIIVMSPEEKSFSLMIQYNLEPEIFGFSILESFAKAIEREGLSGFPVHLKIDTGMMRLGFLPDEVPELMLRLKVLRHLKVESIFSHLAGSEDRQHDNFTSNQIDLFTSICNQIEASLGYTTIKHICNSAGIERFKNAHFNMVRIGIGLYGITSKPHSFLQNVATLKSSITQIKRVNPNQTIGYGRRGILSGEGRIAIVPVGYADGLDRRLGNGVGKVWINGFFAPILGSVCMDMCMVDVSHIECKEGDAVTLFDEHQTISDLANAIGTIPYEILTGISRRVKRVYFMD